MTVRWKHNVKSGWSVFHVRFTSLNKKLINNSINYDQVPARVWLLHEYMVRCSLKRMCSQIGSQCRERRVGLDNRVTYMYTQSWSLMQYSSKCIAIHFWWGVGLGVALNLSVFSWIVGFYHSNAFYFWRLWIPIDLTAPIVLIRLLCTLGHWESTSQVENVQQHHNYYDQSYTQTTCMWCGAVCFWDTVNGGHD